MIQSASHEKEFAMLVLSRRSHESVVIGGSSGFDRVVRITVIDVRDGTVKLGIEADADTPVYRSEVPLRIFPDALGVLTAAHEQTRSQAASNRIRLDAPTA
jgi:carbon storage regulator CsrA